MWKLLALFVLNGFLQPGIFLKNQKPAQTLTLERSVTKQLNKNYIEGTHRVDRIGRNVYAFSANFSFLQDLPPSSIKIQTYAEFGNEYKRIPLSFAITFCEFYNNWFTWLKNDLVDSKIPPNCTLTKGSYYIRNCVPNGGRLPFVSPWKKIMSNYRLFVTQTGETICEFEVYSKFSDTEN